MNTADRSISLLDAALRRRFGFVELMPDTKTLQDAFVGDFPLRAWLEAINAKIRLNIGRDARNLQIGHAYLMHRGRPISDIAVLKRVIRDDILPLLEEYCYDDFATLAKIVGKAIIDVAESRIRDEQFEDGNETNLFDALLSHHESLSSSTVALQAQPTLDQSTAESEEEDDA
jgi:5-methylcytosine-specific restriction protein B